ncbi:MAG: radical SAM protein, partial [Aquifex sp.]
ETRKYLMPHAGKLEEVVKVLEEELPKLSSKKRKKISLAYLLLKGVNDSKEDLEQLSALAKRLGVSVTLLYYNKTFEFETVSEDEYEKAFLLLRSKGLRVTLSTRFRKDKLGGCGTLVVNRK